MGKLKCMGTLRDNEGREFGSCTASTELNSKGRTVERWWASILSPSGGQLTLCPRCVRSHVHYGEEEDVEKSTIARLD